MNSNIIPQGPREIVSGAHDIANALEITAHTDATISALVFIFPKTPANAGAVDTFTLKAGGKLHYVKSCHITTANVVEVVYLP